MEKKFPVIESHTIESIFLLPLPLVRYMLISSLIRYILKKKTKYGQCSTIYGWATHRERAYIYHKNDPSNWSNRASVKIVKQQLAKSNRWDQEKENTRNVLDVYIRHFEWKMSISLVTRKKESERERQKTAMETQTPFPCDDSVWIFRFCHRLIYFTWS